MIYKNLDIRISQYEEDGKSKAGIETDAYVVIKRDGQYYQVPVRQRYDLGETSFNEDVEEMINFFKHNFDMFLERCRDVEEKWKLMDEVETPRGRMLIQKPFNIHNEDFSNGPTIQAEESVEA